MARRQTEARPVLAEFAAWIEQESSQLLPKHPLCQAMEYARTNWSAPVRYCDDGRLDPDNLEAERALRGIAVGRRNWLFCGSDRGGRAAAVHFSLIASCARHELDPFAYLPDLFTQLPALKAKPDPAALRNLLPIAGSPIEQRVPPDAYLFIAPLSSHAFGRKQFSRSTWDMTMYSAPREMLSELPMLAVRVFTGTRYAERRDVSSRPSRLDDRNMVGSHDRSTVFFARPTLRGF